MPAFGRGKGDVAGVAARKPKHREASSSTIACNNMASLSKDAPVDPVWRWATAAAVLIAAALLGLFYYWFAVANRYTIFLYGHTARGIPLTQPFDAITRSRYWMGGLVATAIVMMGYVGLLWALGRIAVFRDSSFRPPCWWRVWFICAPLLLVGIPAITMTINQPTLPPFLALACVVSTLAGLAVALLPGEWAAERPRDLAWLAADGAGLIPILLLVKAVELPVRGVSVPVGTGQGFALTGLLLSMAWLAVMTAMRIWRRRSIPGWPALLVAGLALSYMVLPLVHFVLAAPPGHRYISTASNFFAFNPALQLLILAIAAAISYSTTRVRRRLAAPGVSR